MQANFGVFYYILGVFGVEMADFWEHFGGSEGTLGAFGAQAAAEHPGL